MPLAGAVGVGQVSGMVACGSGRGPRETLVYRLRNRLSQARLETPKAAITRDDSGKYSASF